MKGQNIHIQPSTSYISGAERLRGLLKILPEPEEIELLNNFDGDIAKLGPAEQFLLQLIHIPDYKLRIECEAPDRFIFPKMS